MAVEAKTRYGDSSAPLRQRHRENRNFSTNSFRRDDFYELHGKRSSVRDGMRNTAKEAKITPPRYRLSGLLSITDFNRARFISTR